MSSITRHRTLVGNLICENPLYHFKGALRAPGRGWPPPMAKRRAMAALTVGRRSFSP
jgi:hypothetical protein